MRSKVTWSKLVLHFLDVHLYTLCSEVIMASEFIRDIYVNCDKKCIILDHFVCKLNLDTFGIVFGKAVGNFFHCNICLLREIIEKYKCRFDFIWQKFCLVNCFTFLIHISVMACKPFWKLQHSRETRIMSHQPWHTTLLYNECRALPHHIQIYVLSHNSFRVSWYREG